MKQKNAARYQAGNQIGAITLPVSLILLVLLTLITVFAARVGVLETRASANKVRYDEAFQAAEAGVQQAAAYLGKEENRSAVLTAAWSKCNAVPDAFPCSEIPTSDKSKWVFLSPGNITTPPTVGSFTLFFMTPCKDCAAGTPTLYDYAPITLIAQGRSADGSGEAVVRQGMTFFKVGNGTAGAPVPFVAPGNIPLSGNYSIVVNPNGGGKGVALSVWTNSSVNLSGGSVITCQVDEFLKSSTNSHDTTTNPGIDMCSSCVCQPNTTGTLSVAGASPIKNYDILDNDPNFPSDVFQMFTGTPATNWSSFRDYVKSINDAAGPHYLTNCDSLTTNSHGWYWVDGDCDPPNNVGKLSTHGVRLIVNGNAHFAANTYLFGVVLMFTPPPATTKRDFKTNGNFTLYGAILANQELNMLLNGSFVLRYVEDLFTSTPGTPPDSGFGKVPNSWSDF